MTAILYSFRRCPYAMRARMALHYSGVDLEQRDIELKNKPAAMLAASAKGTVPVLVLANGEVIDESLDIMHWAIGQYDPKAWYQNLEQSVQQGIDQLIAQCDQGFKPCLDKYKYWVGYPEKSQLEYRQQCEKYLRQWDQQLSQQAFLLSEQVSLADMAIFPFVRQFAYVDIDWFNSSPYQDLKRWLTGFLDSREFKAIMTKREIWQEP